jgi:hypothetical protein
MRASDDSISHRRIDPVSECPLLAVSSPWCSSTLNGW